VPANIKLNKGTKVPQCGLPPKESKALTMFNPWMSLGMKAWQIGLEAQSVIILRMLRLAAGGARAEAEASRMVTEKSWQLARRRWGRRRLPCVDTKSMSSLARPSMSTESAFAPTDGGFPGESNG
jgi:hypothetical protein